MIKHILFYFIVSLLFIKNTSATKWYVDDADNTNDVYTSLSIAGNDANNGDASAPFASISQAIAIASSGDTILIDAGTYLPIATTTVTKSLTLIGAGTSLTIIDGGNQVIFGLQLTDHTIVTIKKITLTNFDEDVISYRPSTNDTISCYIDSIKLTNNTHHGLFFTGNGHLAYFKCTNSEFTFNGTASPYRGVYTNGLTVDTAIVENCYVANNGFVGVDFNAPNSDTYPNAENRYARIINCVINNHPQPAIALNGFRSGLIQNNSITDAGYASIELKTCAGNGMESGPGSLVVSHNIISQSVPNIDTRDVAGIAAINRDQNIAGVNGTLASSGIYIFSNEISGYTKLTTPVTFPAYTSADTARWNNYPYSGLAPDSLFDACGIIVEGFNHKIVANKISNCEFGIMIQERPNYTGLGDTYNGLTRPPMSAFFDATRCYPTSTANTIIQKGGFFNCKLAIKAIGLTSVLDASFSYLGQTTPAGAQSRVQAIPTHMPIAYPSTTPAPAPIVSGVPTGMIDYTPWLKYNSDLLPLGFQGDLSYLVVDDDSPQASSAGRVQEAHDTVQGNNNLIVEISQGFYDEYNTVSKTLSYLGISTPLIKTVKMNGDLDTLKVTGSFDIQDSLLLVDGLINTTNTEIITMRYTAVANTGSATSFVNGPLNAQATTTGNVLLNLPVGKATYGNRYMQFDFTKTAAGLDTYTAEYFPTGAPTLTYTKPILPTWVAKSYWSLLPANYNGFSNAQMRLHYGSNDYDTISNKQTIVKDNNAGAWLNLKTLQPQFNVLLDTSIASSTALNANFTTLGKFALAPVFDCNLYHPLAATTATTCSGVANNNDGKIEAFNFLNGIDQFDFTSGNSYSGSATYNNGAQFIPNNGLLTNTLNYSPINEPYTVRFFNDYGCVRDTTVTLATVDCSILPVTAISKNVTVTYPTDSTAQLAYNLYVQNMGLDTAFNVIVRDSLKAMFPSTSYTINSISSTGYLTLNPLFDGNLHDTLTATNVILPPLTQNTISFIISFVHHKNAGPYTNTAFVVADGVMADSSTVGNNPDNDNDGNPYEINDNQPTIVYLSLPPIAMPDTALTNEDVAFNVIAAANGGASVLVNDSDPNGNNTISTPMPITSGLLVPNHGTVDINGLYTPMANYHGIDTVYYVICDNTTPIAFCDTSYIVITIISVNDPPVAVLDTVSLFSGQTVTINMNTNNTDADNNLDVTSTIIIHGPNHGNASTNPTTGVITYTADSNYFGIDTIIVSICDLGTPVYCTNDTLIINIQQPDYAPIAVDDAASLLEDGSLNINPLNNDYDNNAQDSIVITQVVQPQYGTATLNPDGTITYIPNANYNGTDTIHYTVCSGTPQQCSLAVIVITVNPVNDIPVVINNQATTTINTPVSGTININNNDTIDGTVVMVDTITVIQAPSNGTIVMNTNGSYTYTPNNGFAGIDTIVYQVCDNGVPLPAICMNDTLFITVSPTVNILGLAKNTSVPVLQNDGSYMVTYTIIAKNYSSAASISNVQITDDLIKTFATPASFTVINIHATNNSTLVVNNQYNGSSVINTLNASLSVLAPQASDTVVITVNVFLNNTTATSFSNTAMATGINTLTNLALQDSSNNGLDPLTVGTSDPMNSVNNKPTTFSIIGNAIIGVAKKASEPIFNEFDGSFSVNYTITLKNYGNTTLTNVQIYENLNRTFPTPVMYTIKAGSVITTGGITYNTNFASTVADTLLLVGNNILQVGQQATISFALIIELNGSMKDVYNNSVIAKAQNNQGQQTTDISTNGIDPNPINTSGNNPSEVGENVTTPITLVPTDVFVPSGFSPDGDGVNDLLIIKGIEWFPNNDLQLFNRWGNKVYSIANYQNTWDGNCNIGLHIGDKVQPGTYYYMLDFKTKVNPKTGYIEVRY